MAWSGPNCDSVTMPSASNVLPGTGEVVPSTPAIYSSVLAVRCVGRSGQTLTTSSRSDSALTWPARTVMAYSVGCTACTDPPVGTGAMRP